MTSIKHLSLAALLALPLLPAAGRAETLASAGSESISREEFEVAAQQRSTELKHALSADERRELLLSIVNQRLLVAEARRRKLDKEAGFKAARDDFERRSLAERVYSEEVVAKANISPQELRQAYDQDPERFDVLDLSQIVITPSAALSPDEAAKKAATLAKKLQAKPKGFAAAAKAESDDARSKARGGDLGSLQRGQLLPELAKAAFALKPGEVSDPVQTQYGYHILMLRQRKHIGFEDASETLSRGLHEARAAELQKALLEKLAQSHKVKLPEGAF
jgi:parvulin-like peptidyl-prolyl isomerase